MCKDDCQRVIVFGSGLRQDDDEPWKVFHSFELCAPKEYLLQRLDELQAERTQRYYAAMEKSGINEMFNRIIPPVFDDNENEA